MKKIYELDTNVLLADPNAMYTFEDNDVVIPTVVLQELDSKKKLMDELGRNARYVSRQLDKLREKGKLHEGVSLPNGGTLKVISPPSNHEVYNSFLDDSVDTAIIATAHELQKLNPEIPVIVVSRDVNVRIKADASNVLAEDYLNDKVISAKDDKYTGFTELDVDGEDIDFFYKERKLIMHKEFPENHFVVLKCGKQSALTRYSKGFVYPLYKYDEDEAVFGLFAKNFEQRLALDLLLDENIPLVTLSGKAGTGKTLLALAAALRQSQDSDTYNKVIVARPIVAMGKDLGYLPGELNEKLAPWMQPIYDNLEFLFDCKNQEELTKMLAGYEDMIQIEALTYIRGRSIPKQFMIIDEAQNLTKHEAKTILTRVGDGTKIVLVGDPDQIDNPYLDAYSNGLTYVIEKMKNLKESGHVTLSKGERSGLAQLAADIL
jgi:PhoH-like ATPase